jgi:hypothetical protein
LNQPNPNNNVQAGQDLLLTLRETSESELIAGVSRVEGTNGSTVEPVYNRRKLICYSITEDELQVIAVTNTISTSLFALGSFFFGLALDFVKDSLSVDTVVSESMLAVNYYVKAGASVLCIVCWVAGVAAFFWRKHHWKKIKSSQTL